MSETVEVLERFEKAHEVHEEQAGGHSSSLARLAAVSVAIIAAFLAISTFLGNEAVKEAIQGQTKVADANAVSQTFDTQDEVFQVLQSELIVLGQSSDEQLATAAEAAGKSLESTEKRVPAHEEKLKEKLAEAKKEVKAANDQHLLYEIAEVLLQIAIVLASVAIVANRRFLLFGGHGLAVGGVATLVVGYLVQ